MNLSLAPAVVLSAAVLCGSNLQAEDTAAERFEAATNQLKRVAEGISARCLNQVQSLDAWQKARPELRRQLRDMLGLEPQPARTPLHARITGLLERGVYRIEKVVFQSLPGLYVTGNFYVPAPASKPLPTILYLCGHSADPRGAKVDYQDRAQWFAAHGYACLVLDTLEFGEVAGIHHGTHNLDLWHWLSLGYTPAGVEVWNAIRALDYLESRPEVDRARLGATGISGGGAMTWYTAALDDRIAAAVPVCSTYTFGSQAAHWIAAGQCDCIYYPDTYLWDFPVVGALITPRPLLMISGQQDPLFPPDGYHAVFQRTKRIYDLFAGGDSDRIREVDDNVGHSDAPLFLREARQWMQRWLQGDATPLPLETNQPALEQPEDLACLSRIPADAVNDSIHDRFIATATLKAPASRAAWERRRTELVSRLEQRVFRWFPTERIPFETRVSGGDAGYLPRYANYEEVSFQSEAGVRVHGRLLTPRQVTAPLPLLVCVKSPGGSVYAMDTDHLLPLLGHCTVLILYPRFTERPLTAAEHTNLERTSAWVGRTIAAMQVWDILRTVRWAVDERRLSASSISLYGRGEMGVLALYAGLFDPRIDQVILSDAPASHWQGPALLNVLRVTDIPEVAGALAPRRLASLTRLPEAFDLTRRIYRLEQASQQLTRPASLREALGISASSRKR